MKIISIKQFKAPPCGTTTTSDLPDAPRSGQLVSVKGKLTQFVVPVGDGASNCDRCHFVDISCGRIACGQGHYAEIKLPTTPFTTPKE